MSVSPIGATSAAPSNTHPPHQPVVSGDTKTTTTLPDGASVTTVRDTKSDIISIATTPPTIPANALTGENISSAGQQSQTGHGIDVTA